MKPIREYRWIRREDDNGSNGHAAETELLVKKLSDELTLSPILTNLLVHRGIDTFDKARSFFRPSLDALHDPFLMDGMDAAVERILRAFQARETILVYGDYDVDGTNGTALLHTFLSKTGNPTHFHIPDRVKEGYGISHTGIERAVSLGVTLLISVDCGITAVNQVEEARAAGIDVIICDHHEPGNEIPRACAVLDPLKPNCRYPFKYLCGTGVAFKLIQALVRKGALPNISLDREAEVLEEYLDFVTLASVADIVPLVDENRLFVKLGLERINQSPRAGIKALIDSSGLQPGTLNAGQILFTLAPRINAVGRLGDAGRAVRLLTSPSYEAAVTIAQVCEEENKNRRKLDEDAFLDAQQMVERLYADGLPKAFVLHNPSWHPGVIGIVASRLVERYYRPSIMLTTVDGVAKGSARSIAGFDIHTALKNCEDKLLQFGGHKFAAGLTLELGRVDEFRIAFEQTVNGVLTEELLTPTIQFDTELNINEITPKFVRIVNMFEPFGPQNPRPMFITKGLELLGRPRVVGGNHLRFKVRNNGKVMDAIGFGLAAQLDRLPPERKMVDLAFSISENTYAGETYTQLVIKDIK